MADYDLAIIGGGLNGAAIARDAAGRGLRVVLIEQDDLGSGQSACLGLMQGRVTAIEKGALRRIRRSLVERDRWLHNAPHLVRPLPITMPAHEGRRPLWPLRAMLHVYDRLAPGRVLPRSETLDITHHEAGVPLKRPFGLAFAWPECLADVSRLAVLAAVDAAERGATILTGARCVRADRGKIWQLALVDRGRRTSMSARALVNATGAWIPSVTDTVLRLKPPPVRLTIASQIVVRRRFDYDGIYAFQNGDGEFIYAAPWHADFTIIGTAARPFVGDPAIAAASAVDIDQLCRTINRYFRERVEPSDVVYAQSAAHAFSARGGDPHLGTVLRDASRGAAPLVTVFGGDVTLSRRRAEIAVDRLTPFYPMSPPWTARTPLPGGDVSWQAIGDEAERVRERWPFLNAKEAARFVSAYGTRTGRVLGDARTRSDLGPQFGPDLTGAEVRYLMAHEWSRFPDDILWRRSKLGLSMPKAARDALAQFMMSPPLSAEGDPQPLAPELSPSRPDAKTGA
ncbi:MAG: glycerol-3-phosphate dehydrogenase [Proteobacteria bacterium SG_bin9]|nr:MAG: glycerol-3-phosphate dehydrogenase [Proteobacteria bacterium SG_bin9]